MQIGKRWVMAAILAATACTVGCEIDKHQSGDNKNVKISTPFGGVQVKSNDDVVPGEIGLPLYPGATVVKKDNDNGSADVNMSFGSFQMRVKAASFRTADPPDKVEAFYRNGLRRYGDVIACRNSKPVGTPLQTSDGLTCDDTKNKTIVISSDSEKGDLHLKAGAREHQHVVDIHPDGGGTKFGLIALDLPGKLFSDSKDDAGRQ